MTRLASQPWMTATSVQRVMAAFDAIRPGCARFVGGCVRNALLGEPVADIDIATQLTPDLVMKAMTAAGIAVHPTGLAHGTLTLVVDHDAYEVTTLRQDVATDGRHATVVFTDDWRLDALRRDFRFNALYAGSDGEVFDPTGGGLEDVAARRIIFVGNPEVRIREDYLRILRFFRFHAWYGRSLIDPAGLRACAALKEGLREISVERIWMEVRKLMAAQKPLGALRAMEEGGVLGELFPESKGLDLLSKLIGLEIRERVPADPMIRFLALFWKDAAAVESVTERLKMSNDERDRLRGAVSDKTPLWGGVTEHEVRCALYRSGEQTIRDRILLEWASDGSADWLAVYQQAISWRRPVMPVSGEDLLALGLRQGPAIGQLLRRLEEAWIRSDFQLSHEDLIARAGEV